MGHLRNGGVGRNAGAADEEGDAEVVFVDLHLMGGEAKLPEGVAVVGTEDDIPVFERSEGEGRREERKRSGRYVCVCVCMNGSGRCMSRKLKVVHFAPNPPGPPVSHVPTLPSSLPYHSPLLRTPPPPPPHTHTCCPPI